MKTYKGFICSVLIVLVLTAQLMNPIWVRAEEGTPPPTTTDTPVPSETTAPTEVVTDTPIASDTPVVDTATPSPTDAVTDTPAAETATPSPTDALTDTPVVDTTTASPTDAVTDTPTAETATPSPTDAVTATPTAETATPSPTDALTDTPVVDTATPAPTDAVTDTPTANVTDTPSVETATLSSIDSTTADSTTIDQPTLLETVPDNTNIVVLDQNGDPLSLVTQQAADAIATSDPIWCPDSIPVPTPGLNGCTPSYPTMNDLLANQGLWINSQTIGGTIWITSGAVADVNPITIDGSVYSHWAGYGLTLQGDSNGTGINSSFSVPITIQNWKNNVWVQNITVTGASGTGIYINTSGSINAANITANGNGGRGAELNGDAGVTLTGTNQFNDNLGLALGTGLVVHTINGNINVNQITADGNKAFGAWFETKSGGNVTLTGTEQFKNQFNGNGVDGVVIFSAGNATLNNVTANTNTSIGLNIQVQGDISGENITADGNKATSYGGGWFETFGSGGDITLTGTNIFNNTTGSNGLAAFSTGSINISNLTASSNGGYGAFLRVKQGPGTITLAGNSNTFNNNGLNAPGSTILAGLFVQSVGGGQITLNNITADDNEERGVWIFTPGNATIGVAEIKNNNKLNNGYYGLDAAAVCGIYDRSGNNLDSEVQPRSGVYTVTPPFGQTVTITCTPKIYINGVLLGVPQVLPYAPPASSFQIIDIDCTVQSLYPRELPNGDHATISCPLPSGKATLSRQDNTELPRDLPAGYSYVSSLNLDIPVLQDPSGVEVIKDGGRIDISFMDPAQDQAVYSILYFDPKNQQWVPLKEYSLNSNGGAQTFDFAPGDPVDLRKIYSGVRLTEGQWDVQTNFAGTFVLAQHQ